MLDTNPLTFTLAVLSIVSYPLMLGIWVGWRVAKWVQR